MKKILIIVAFLFLALNLYSFDWVQVNPLLKTYSPIQIKVLEANQKETVIKVSVAGFAKIPETINGKEYYRLVSPGATPTREKGKPAIPYVSFNVMLPNAGGYKISLNEETKSYLLDKKLLPSKGSILRTEDPAKVPYVFGSVYKSNEFYPKNTYKVDGPFVFRRVRGIRVVYYPFRYSPATDSLVVVKEAVLIIRRGDIGSGKNEINLKSNNISDIGYQALYSKYFVNFEKAAPNYGYGPMIGKKYLLIICPDQFRKAIQPLIDWKKKIGFEVTVGLLSEIGKTNTAIRDYIQDKYNEGKVSYIILVGDTEFIPYLRGVKEGAPSDPCYTKLAGDDNEPDAMISRISAKNEEDVAYQVYKFIQYESNPFTGDEAKWYNMATGIASAEGNPTDYERADELRDALLAYKYKTVDQIYDPGASVSKVAAALNEGRALINYIGHGSKTYWVTSRFGNRDIQNLHNGLKLPVIWDVACVNGAFHYGGDCFAETWLKAGSKDDPKGAVMIFASSTNQEWVPPCVVQKEINNELIAKEKYTTVGELATNGIMKGFQVYGDGDRSSGTMMMEQWHIFGDCSLTIRTDVPHEIDVTARKVGDRVVVEVKGDKKDLARLTITCYDPELKNVQVASLTDGKAEFKATSGKQLVTVYGFNVKPVVDLEVK